MALDDASFEFDEGELVSLLGPSGCGKTTLLRIVGGLIPKSSGSVVIGGREITGPLGDYGFVFQAPSLMPWRTVMDNVLFPMEILKRNDAAARRHALELLDLVGLSGFLSARPHQLSGGMQQRVALCRALIHQPKLLLMDEPFGALDELTRLEMNDLLLRIRRETKASVLFVTHSISEAVYLSDKVIVFSRRPARVATGNTDRAALSAQPAGPLHAGVHHGRTDRERSARRDRARAGRGAGVMRCGSDLADRSIRWPASW